ncbi:filamin-B-like isoform X2 [Pomacea canaliculata]|uniref:filamin-B-like isoform X2 n=1 Tax=Pomacea canaliculata TaxID=400727 RepID=UPI000D7341CF|nr:filamin-B-like isoform X2 [Pomacea canaliculata]
MAGGRSRAEKGYQASHREPHDIRQTMAKYRRRRNTLLASGSNLSDVPLIEIWFAIIGAIWWLGAALWKLWQLNPFSLIIERQRRLYYHDNRGALTIRPPWTERLADMFRSDETRKAKLLAWVQDMVPRMPVDDFMSSWHDGVVLCCLLEEVCPGLCPRPELLKPHHRVNNCRLGIKLAQKYLRLPKMMITAEEMAIADKDTELKIIHLVQLIKWKYQRGPASLPPSPMSQSRPPSPKVSLAIKVVARGTGLKAGIVGRRAKFNIFSDSASYLDLHIEIQGPNNEVNSERIVSIPHGINKKDARAAAGYPGGSDEDGRAKLIEDDVGNMF